MEENRKYFFAICTWPNSPVRANFLSRFQFDGKNNVWIIQVRRVFESPVARLPVVFVYVEETIGNHRKEISQSSNFVKLSAKL